jgi:PITH domain
LFEYVAYQSTLLALPPCLQGDLCGQINTAKMQVLNADSKCDVASVLTEDGGLLLSDVEVDEQLLIHIPFTNAVKIREFVIVANKPSNDEGNDHFFVHCQRR